MSARKRLQWLLDQFHYSRKYVMCVLAYGSMRLYGVEPTFEEIRSECYEQREHNHRNLDEAQDLDGLLEIAKDCWKGAVDRRVAIADKCKTLLTLSSLLLGLVGAMLPKQLTFDAGWMRFLVFVAAIALLNAVALLIVFFGVGKEVVLALGQDEVNLDKENIKKSLINTYVACQVAIDSRTDYLVDVFKTARFFFLSAFSILVILFSINFFNRQESDQAERTIAELRGRPELIELLRGPKGERGESGPRGLRGEQGTRGEKGEQGMQGVVDQRQVLDALLKDPRLKAIVERTVQDISTRTEDKSPEEVRASK